MADEIDYPVMIKASVGGDGNPNRKESRAGGNASSVTRRFPIQVGHSL